VLPTYTREIRAGLYAHHNFFFVLVFNITFLSLSDAMSSENAIQGAKVENKEELISSPPKKKL
jgi:predicted GIY-YIG superfamily endonuclease